MIQEKIKKTWTNVDKAIRRISWRFNNGSFTPNQNDVDALNGIIEWVNNQRKITLNENVLFVKLLIYNYNQGISYYKSSVFSKIPQQDLARRLEMDLEQYYITFTDNLNMNNISEVLSDNGIESKHVWLMNEKEKMDHKLKVSKMSKEDVLKLKNNKWELEDVRDNLNLMATEALNRFQ